MNLARERGCDFGKVRDLGKASDLGKVNDLGKACDFGKATYLSLSATVRYYQNVCSRVS